MNGLVFNVLVPLCLKITTLSEYMAVKLAREI